MKNKLILTWTGLLCILCSCSRETPVLKEDETIGVSSVMILPSQAEPTSDIVVLYKVGTTQAQKQLLYDYVNNGAAGNPSAGIPPLAPTQFNVINPIACLHSYLEKWEITEGEEASIIIQHLNDSANGEEEDEDLEDTPYHIISAMDIDFLFYADTGVGTPNNSNTTNSVNGHVNPDHDIKIAVLDSGFSGSGVLFGENIFLYDSSSNPCPSLSGWDFVSEDNIPFDSHPQKHGSLVTHLIQQPLSNAGLSPSILPLRVANEEGRIEYFKLMQAMEYAINQNVSVINASFGWTGDIENTSIISEFILQHPKIMFVCSAGNDAEDTDYVAHFPSGLPFENVLAVTAINEVGNSFKSLSQPFFSNYGEYSVDFAAHGIEVPILDHDGEIIILPSSQGEYRVSGTSFSAAKATAIVAQLMYDWEYTLSAEDIRAHLEDMGEELSQGEVTHWVPTYYNRFLNLECCF